MQIFRNVFINDNLHLNEIIVAKITHEAYIWYFNTSDTHSQYCLKITMIHDNLYYSAIFI